MIPDSYILYQSYVFLRYAVERGNQLVGDVWIDHGDGSVFVVPFTIVMSKKSSKVV